MSWTVVAGGASALFLLVYLFIILLKAERL
jgi:hypothetical protein